MASSPLCHSEKTVRKIDIAQVSLNLQDRLGLAKVKYQNGRLLPRDSRQPKNRQDLLASDEAINSSISEFHENHCETPLTSPSLRTVPYSREFARQSQDRHAATLSYTTTESTLSVSRKRLRSDSATDQPTKMARVSWKSSYQLPESSPAVIRTSLSRSWQSVRPKAISEESPSAYCGLSDDGNDPDLPTHSFQNVSSMINSSPPRTPPPMQSRQLRNYKSWHNEDGADLLLYLANSPTPLGNPGRPQTRAFPPSTPPSQHAVFPSMTPTTGHNNVFQNVSTPCQQFNFSDFVNVTPSPAQRPWGSRTPGGAARTPLATKDVRRRLNSDNLVQLSAESPKGLMGDGGLALQLGGELRP